VSINGSEILERADVQRALSKVRAGQEIKLRYNRQGRTLNKEVKVTVAPDFSKLPEGAL